jgi:hypothetical protein
MMYNLSVAVVATYLVGTGKWVVHNVDLSGIDPNIARRLLRFNLRGRNQDKLNAYVNNLVTQAAKIQNLEHVLNFYSGQYNKQVSTGRENPRIMAIELGNDLIVTSVQRQLPASMARFFLDGMIHL